ncbi:MAG TPA: hypothetical protein PKX93_08085 [bacterium]|nr:hypothetical protein [bacterium]HOL67398.1 hypothetical protein [bacterium]HPP12206.1 hypothetical protein [bacterium]
MTAKERVEKVLRGGHAEKVPFTIYESKIPQCEAERMMRNQGLCILCRTSVFRVHLPEVKVTQYSWEENGRKRIRTLYETPVGTLSSVEEPAGFTSWHLKWLFEKPEDYKPLLFMIQNERYEPAYEEVLEKEKMMGGDGLFRAGIGSEPLQQLISRYMGTETFCYEWMERRDEVLKLYQAIAEQRRKVYPIVARSPLLHANYGGNVVPEIIGLENFEKYYVPHYQEAAEIMHRHGKLLGSHFDANCRLLAEAISRTDLDYIEAFTPAPDTDLTLAEARKAWPDKVLWLNFPSSLHLKSDEEVEKATVELLNELESVDGLIMGITEDIPPHRWPGSCQAIMAGLERHSREHPSLYR